MPPRTPFSPLVIIGSWPYRCWTNPTPSRLSTNPIEAMAPVPSPSERTLPEKSSQSRARMIAPLAGWRNEESARDDDMAAQYRVKAS
jgi:hypothetical protein